MSATAIYYIEYRYNGSMTGRPEWRRYSPTKDTEKRHVLRVARFQAENYPSMPHWRVRHRGRVIARWKDGKRVRR